MLLLHSVSILGVENRNSHMSLAQSYLRSGGTYWENVMRESAAER